VGPDTTSTVVVVDVVCVWVLVMVSVMVAVVVKLEVVLAGLRGTLTVVVMVVSRFLDTVGRRAVAMEVI
jgi:hypothetical protein